MLGKKVIGKEGFVSFIKTTYGWRVKRVGLYKQTEMRKTSLMVVPVKDHGDLTKELIISGCIKKPLHVGSYCKTPHHYF